MEVKKKKEEKSIVEKEAEEAAKAKLAEQEKLDADIKRRREKVEKWQAQRRKVFKYEINNC